MHHDTTSDESSLPAMHEAVTLSIQLFGTMTVSLQSDGFCVSPVLSPRSAELLAFLAVGRDRCVGRDDIADAIWGTEHEVSAGSFNTALWRLRRSMENTAFGAGSFLTVNRQGGVGLSRAKNIVCDVRQFEQYVFSPGRIAASPLDAARRRQLETGVSLYRDPALGDFRAGWALRERERLRNAYLDALQTLMHDSAAGQDYGSAIRYARAILAADALREDTHRALMRYLVAAGQRAAALRQYEICRSALRHELAIQPMRETLILYQQIGDGALCVTGSSSTSIRHTSELTVVGDGL